MKPLNKVIQAKYPEKYNIDQNIIDYVLEIDIGFNLTIEVINLSICMRVKV